MSDADNIPDTYLNKAQIAVKYSISRVTVDRYLKKLENEGRLFPQKVQQGKRILYHYDPNDLDTHIMPLLQNNKKQVTVQKNVSSVINVQTQSQIELLNVNLQNAEKRLLEKDELIADLKDQREKNYKTIEFLQTQITDQRPVVLPEAPEPKREEVVPTITEVEQPKPATVKEIREAVSRASKPNLKKPIQRNVTNSAFFVKEPEVSTLDPASTAIKTEIDREETPDITMARLKYKVDRGEYKLAETVYAQQVWNIIIDRKDEVPDKVRDGRYNDVLWEMRSKTNTAFDTKFKTKELLEISDYTEIHRHLREDLKSRALEEPLLQFPNDLAKEIAEEKERLAKENVNVVELKDVKQQKALDEAKQDDEDLDRLLPDVMDHFNPMAEAELALLDEEIASAREAKAKVEAKEEQPKPKPPTLDMDKPTEVEDEAEIEAEARRTRMVEAPKVQKKKPRGLIAWLKGY